MTFKFPLINLVARGHLPLSNRISSLNFAKSLDDGPATKICYEMMKFDNPKDSASYLEEAQRVFEKERGERMTSLTEDYDFRHQRDLILCRESRDSLSDDSIAGSCARVANLIKAGMVTAAITYMLSKNEAEQRLIWNNLQKGYSKSYVVLRNNWIGRGLKLPQDNGDFFKRLAMDSVGARKNDGSRYLTKVDSTNLKNFMGGIVKGAGIAAAIAVSVTAALVMISTIYKRYFSAEAKQCNKFGGKERTVCLTKARIKACEAAIEQSKKALLDCGSAKNEEDCIFKMKVEIRSWTKKKLSEEEKLKKLLNVNSSAFNDSKPKVKDPFQ